MKSVSRKGFSALLSASLICLAIPAYATGAVDIPVPPPAEGTSETGAATLDYLNKAKDAYTSGHYKEALDDIAHAQKEIRLRHAGLYRTLLPAAPKGWKADDSSAGSALNLPALGGMTIIARKYSANGHDVGIAFIVDVPTVVAGALMTPPPTTGDASAISFVDVKGNKALYKEGTNAKTGVPTHTLTSVAGPVVILVSSSTLGKDTLAQFSGLIDYDGLKKIQ